MIWVREGRVMGLCTSMNSSNDKGIDHIYKAHISYLRAYCRSLLLFKKLLEQQEVNLKGRELDTFPSRGKWRARK